MSHDVPMYSRLKFCPIQMQPMRDTVRALRGQIVYSIILAIPPHLLRSKRCLMTKTARASIASHRYGSKVRFLGMDDASGDDLAIWARGEQMPIPKCRTVSRRILGERANWPIPTMIDVSGTNLYWWEHWAISTVPHIQATISF